MNNVRSELELVWSYGGLSPLCDSSQVKGQNNKIPGIEFFLMYNAQRSNLTWLLCSDGETHLYPSETNMLTQLYGTTQCDARSVVTIDFSPEICYVIS